MGNGGEGRGEEGEVKGREGDWCPPHMTCLHDAPAEHSDRARSNHDAINERRFRLIGLIRLNKRTAVVVTGLI